MIEQNSKLNKGFIILQQFIDKCNTYDLGSLQQILIALLENPEKQTYFDFADNIVTFVEQIGQILKTNEKMRGRNREIFTIAVIDSLIFNIYTKHKNNDRSIMNQEIYQTHPQTQNQQLIQKYQNMINNKMQSNEKKTSADKNNESSITISMINQSIISRLNINNMHDMFERLVGNQEFFYQIKGLVEQSRPTLPIKNQVYTLLYTIGFCMDNEKLKDSVFVENSKVIPKDLQQKLDKKLYIKLIEEVNKVIFSNKLSKIQKILQANELGSEHSQREINFSLIRIYYSAYSNKRTNAKRQAFQGLQYTGHDMLHNLFKMYITGSKHKKMEKLFTAQEECNAIFAFILNYMQLMFMPILTQFSEIFDYHIMTAYSSSYQVDSGQDGGGGQDLTSLEMFYNKLITPVRDLLIPFLIDLPPEFSNFFAEIYDLVTRYRQDQMNPLYSLKTLFFNRFLLNPDNKQLFNQNMVENEQFLKVANIFVQLFYKSNKYDKIQSFKDMNEIMQPLFEEIVTSFQKTSPIEFYITDNQLLQDYMYLQSIINIIKMSSDDEIAYDMIPFQYNLKVKNSNETEKKQLKEKYSQNLRSPHYLQEEMLRQQQNQQQNYIVESKFLINYNDDKWKAQLTGQDDGQQFSSNDQSKIPENMKETPSPDINNIIYQYPSNPQHSNPDEFEQQNHIIDQSNQQNATASNQGQPQLFVSHQLNQQQLQQQKPFYSQQHFIQNENTSAEQEKQEVQNNINQLNQNEENPLQQNPFSDVDESLQQNQFKQSLQQQQITRSQQLTGQMHELQFNQQLQQFQSQQQQQSQNPQHQLKPTPATTLDQQQKQNQLQLVQSNILTSQEIQTLNYQQLQQIQPNNQQQSQYIQQSNIVQMQQIPQSNQWNQQSVLNYNEQQSQFTQQSNIQQIHDIPLNNVQMQQPNLVESNVISSQQFHQFQLGKSQQQKSPVVIQNSKQPIPNQMQQSNQKVNQQQNQLSQTISISQIQQTNYANEIYNSENQQSLNQQQFQQQQQQQQQLNSSQYQNVPLMQLQQQSHPQPMKLSQQQQTLSLLHSKQFFNESRGKIIEEDIENNEKYNQLQQELDELRKQVQDLKMTINEERKEKLLLKEDKSTLQQQMVNIEKRNEYLKKAMKTKFPEFDNFIDNIDNEENINQFNSSVSKFPERYQQIINEKKQSETNFYQLDNKLKDLQQSIMQDNVNYNLFQKLNLNLI